MSTVNVGIIGVGNCASSLVQGVVYYGDESRDPTGLTNPMCVGYAVSDVRFTAAFDVDVAKVGHDLSDAIWVAPNNAFQFAEVPPLGVLVHDGMLSDGVGHHVAERIDVRGVATLDAMIEHLKQTETHVVVNFLPAGSQQASERYAEAAMRAGCAFVNCMPSVIARSPHWVHQFEAAGVPLIGDDLKSQFGATLVHHALIETLARNGVQLQHTYQIVSGGNMDFLNLQDADRVSTKKTSKVQGFGGTELPSENVHFGAEYMPYLKDRKIAFIRLEGTAFGGTPLDIELRMSVEDSPSAAGNVLDAIRYTKAAMDQGLRGSVGAISSLLMKAPPSSMNEQQTQDEIHALIEHVT